MSYCILQMFVPDLVVSQNIFYHKKNGVQKALVSHWKALMISHWPIFPQDLASPLSLIMVCHITYSVHNIFALLSAAHHMAHENESSPIFWPSLVHSLVGVRGDGDVYNNENIISFSNYVHARTAGRGVHFMMADGVSVFGPKWTCGFFLNEFHIQSQVCLTGFLCWRLREHPRNPLKTSLPLPILGCPPRCQNWWPFCL